MFLQYLYPGKRSYVKKAPHFCLNPAKGGMGEGHIYLELCLASYLYFITLIKRMEDLDCAHIYMNSIS